MRVYVSLAATVLVGLLVGCSSASKAPQSKEAAARATDADEQILKTDPLERNYDPHVIMKRAEAFFEKEANPKPAVKNQHSLDFPKAHMLAPNAHNRLGRSHPNQSPTL